jgi:hypothetical protein
MSHPVSEDRLLELAYGELSPPETREVEAHVAGCDACRAALARMTETRRIMSALPEEAAPAAGERALLDAAREAVRRRAPPPRRRARFWGASVALAAVLAVAAVSYRLLVLEPGFRRDDPDALAGGGPYERKGEAAPDAAGPGAGERGSPAPPIAPSEQERPAFATEPPSERPAAPPPERPRERDRFAEAPPRRASPVEERGSPPDGERPGSAALPRRSAEAPPGDARAEATTETPGARAPEREDAAAGAPSQAAPRAGAAAPPPEAREEPTPESAPAPSAARRRSAPAPSSAAASDVRAPLASGAALARYEALRREGALAGEIRTFPGCEGEAWRKLERDPAGRVVKYVREGVIEGRRLRIEHLYGEDGALEVATAVDLDRPGTRLDADALGLDLPHRAEEAAGGPPRCQR